MIHESVHSASLLSPHRRSLSAATNRCRHRARDRGFCGVGKRGSVVAVRSRSRDSGQRTPISSADHQVLSRSASVGLQRRTRASTATQPSGLASTGFRSSSATSGWFSTSRPSRCRTSAIAARSAEPHPASRRPVGLPCRSRSARPRRRQSGCEREPRRADQLRHDAARPVGDERPEDGILDRAHEELDPAVRKGCTITGPAIQHRRARRCRRRAGRDAPARLGLVCAGRSRLDDDGIADRGCRSERCGRRCRVPLLDERQTVCAEQRRTAAGSSQTSSLAESASRSARLRRRGRCDRASVARRGAAKPGRATRGEPSARAADSGYAKPPAAVPSALITTGSTACPRLRGACNRRGYVGGRCDDRRHKEADHRVDAGIVDQQRQRRLIRRGGRRAEDVDRVETLASQG